jgi:hypothetical protein
MIVPIAAPPNVNAWRREVRHKLQPATEKL